MALTGALSALVVGFLLQPVVLRVMRAAAVLDVPSGRSSHTVATPRGGGIAVAVAAAIPLVVYEPARPIAVPLLLFALIGLLEDVKGVPIGARLGLQAGAAVVTGVMLAPLDMSPALATIVALLAAVWIVAYTNAFNFMDGINGISAVHAAVAGAVYAAAGMRHNLVVLTMAGVVIAAAAVTFLPWNAGRAKIFLGDTGSYGLGAVLGTLAAYAVVRGVPLELALAPLALYLADTGSTLLRRWRNGEAWYLPHRTHVYQRLVTGGWSHQQVTTLTALVAVTVCLCAFAATRGGLATRLVLDALAGVTLLAYLLLPSLLRHGRVVVTPRKAQSDRPVAEVRRTHV